MSFLETLIDIAACEVETAPDAIKLATSREILFIRYSK